MNSTYTTTPLGSAGTNVVVVSTEGVAKVEVVVNVWPSDTEVMVVAEIVVVSTLSVDEATAVSISVSVFTASAGTAANLVHAGEMEVKVQKV
jgi:hypothetical protein